MSQFDLETKKYPNLGFPGATEIDFKNILQKGKICFYFGRVNEGIDFSWDLVDALCKNFDIDLQFSPWFNRVGKKSVLAVLEKRNLSFGQRS